MRIRADEGINDLHILHSINDLELDLVTTDKNAEVIFVRSRDLKKVQLPKTLIAIGRVGSGVDNIPLDWCNENGVAVFNAPGINANAVKELVLWGLIESARYPFQMANALIKNPSEAEKIKKEAVGWELAGRTILIIGMGAIGSRVAKMCLGLEMKVAGYDPFVKKESRDPNIIWINSLDDNLEKELENNSAHWPSFITVHCSLNDQNRELVNATLFRAGVKIINFARAELVNEKDLLSELQTGRVSAYISDFLPKQIPMEEFLKTRRCVFLPHLGASTFEAQVRATETVAKEINDFFYYGICQGSVNFPDMPNEKTENDRTRILVSNQNIPGIIKQVTETISAAGLNIGSMTNRSRNDTGIALNYIDIDIKPNNERLLKICQEINLIKGVTKARICTPHNGMG